MFALEPCAEHCVSCKEHGPKKCDECEHGYKLTNNMSCTSSPGESKHHGKHFSGDDVI